MAADPFPHRTFYTLIKTLDPLKVQSRLMNASDKELFFALFYLGADERRDVLSRLSRTKAERLRGVLLRGGRFGQEEYRAAVNHLNLHLSGDKPLPSLKTYYRPGRG
ncbi:MAG: hypothetical protein JEY99_16960 [Spirochaetales bacterium]|nr:hypothetical protein [Spirochaetales bacterium]